MQYFNKDAIQNWLTVFWWKFKHQFWKNGGFRSKKNWFYIIIFLGLLNAFLKEQGLHFQKRIKNQHVFITGAASGLGRLMTIEFAKLGNQVTIVDVNNEGLLETKQIVQDKTKKGENIHTIKVDLTNREEVRVATQQARDKFGDVDILINNAGLIQGKLFTDSREGLTSKSLVVNLECHFWLCNEFLPAMIKKRRGHIVSIASMAGIGGMPAMTDYSASKFGAVGFNEALRLEMKREKTGVNCTTICPYYINTGMFDGVKTSPIYGLLNQHHVVWRIMTAIKQNEGEVCIPWSIGRLAYLAKLIFPTQLLD